LSTVLTDKTWFDFTEHLRHCDRRCRAMRSAGSGRVQAVIGRNAITAGTSSYIARFCVAQLDSNRMQGCNEPWTCQVLIIDFGRRCSVDVVKLKFHGSSFLVAS